MDRTENDGIMRPLDRMVSPSKGLSIAYAAASRAVVEMRQAHDEFLHAHPAAMEEGFSFYGPTAGLDTDAATRRMGEFYYKILLKRGLIAEG